MHDPSAYRNDENCERSSVGESENEDEIEYREDLMEIQGYTNPRHQAQSHSACS
jgi:hypothetical protein